MRKSRIAVSFMSIFICVAVTLCAVNFTAADTLSDAEAHKRKLENKRVELADTLSNLANEKADIISYIKKIDKKMNKVSADMSQLEVAVKSNKKAIGDLENGIAIAQTDIQNQYETMKKRIKYMYEKGNADYIDIIMNSESLSDLLSRSSYIEKITEYDSNMLSTFVTKKNQLETQKTTLVEKKEELEYSMEEFKLEKNALDDISEKKSDELKKYDNTIKKAENKLRLNESELDKQEQVIAEELLEQQKRIAEEEKRKAEEARKAEEKNKTAESAAAGTATPDSSNDTDKNKTDNKKETDKANNSVPDSSAITGTVGFKWPLAVGGKITSYYGKRESPTAGASTYHQGIDISAPAGTAILASQTGTVVTASYSSAAGNYVMINHGGGIFTVYMHACSLNVTVGQIVTQGETIAYVGSTGVSTGAHLHFGITVGGAYVDPIYYVSH